MRLKGNIDYVHLPELAPTQEIVEAYRQGGDANLFERQFLALMKAREVEKTTATELLDGGCLLCSEEKPEHCHRQAGRRVPEKALGAR